MSRTIFLDTNYLIDLMLVERPQRAAALLLFDAIAYGELNAITCATSLKDAYYVATKYIGEPAARKFISSLMEFVSVAEVSNAICRQAIPSNEPDFEDGLIRACAEAARVDFIISRDEKAFTRSPIKRLSTQDYVELFVEYKRIEL